MTKHLRKPKQHYRLLPALVLGCVFSLSVPSQAHASEARFQALNGAPQPSHPSPVDPAKESPSQATVEKLRQAQIEADTKQLYQLCAELRAEVAKTYKESLSLTALKKAQEIEKLARSLKTLMNQDAAATGK